MAERTSGAQRPVAEEVRTAVEDSVADLTEEATTRLVEPVERVEAEVGPEDVQPGAGEPVAAPVDEALLPGSVEEALDGELPGRPDVDDADGPAADLDLPPGVGADREVDTGSVDVSGVAPAGTGPVLDDGFGQGAPTMPTVDDLTPTSAPETPGLEEIRGDQTVISKTLDDGSTGYMIKNSRIDGGVAWQVDTVDGEVLDGREALDHIAQHHPVEPIPTEDYDGPQVDPEWQQRFREDLEENTHYEEIWWDAKKGEAINPDPNAEDLGNGEVDAESPFGPDFADPWDQPVDIEPHFTPEDLDPGTIDPVE